MGDFSSLPPLKDSSKFAKFQSGSYLDDDSQEITKKNNNKSFKRSTIEKNNQSPRAAKWKNNKQNSIEQRPKAKNLTSIERMYDSLRKVNKDTKGEMVDDYRLEHPKVSINVGSTYRSFGPESADGFRDENDFPFQEQQQNLNTFEIATGSINHGNRSISYTVQEILGTCFAINLVVPATEQSWMVFVPSSETILELLRIWKQRHSAENMNKLCTWLLSCITLEFDELMIVAAHFNHSLFQQCYTQEIIENVQSAAIKLQSTMRRYLSNKHLRIQLLKAKQIQESRILAGMRVKALRRQKENEGKATVKSVKDPTFGTNTIASSAATAGAFDPSDLLVSIKQVFSGGDAEPVSPGKKKKRKGSPKKNRRSLDASPVLPVAPSANQTKTLVPHSPSSSAKGSRMPPPSSASTNPRKKKVQLKDQQEPDVRSSIEKEVSNLKVEFDGALHNFQNELESIRSELHSQQNNSQTNAQNSMAFARPASQQQNRSPTNSRGGRPAPHVRSKSGGFEENLSSFQTSATEAVNSNDVDFMKQEIHSLLSKIGTLEEHLAAQRLANERSQEIAKLEIMSAKLEAESAVERAAARVRNETIQEISSQMREIEKERNRLEEERLQKDLIREEAMRREIERKQTHMSEKLKQELFKQQLLQQQEQAALLQRQQELQDKLHKQQQQQVNAAPSQSQQQTPLSNKSTTNNDQISLLPSQAPPTHSQQIASVPSSSSKSAKKPGWNWLLFGGSSKQPPVAQVQQQPPQTFISPFLEPPVIEPVPEEPQEVEEPVQEEEPQEQEGEQEAEKEETAAPEMTAEDSQEQRQNAAVRIIQRAARVMLRRKHFGNNQNFAVLRAEKLLKLIDHAKDENVVNSALSCAMELSHEGLGNKAINRLNNLVAKYDKSNVLYPANYDVLVDFLKHFVSDVNLVKKGFDILNVVMKISPERFDQNDQTLTELLMLAVDVHITDPLMCFKVTRCIYRLNEKSAKNRESFGSNVANLMVLRKLFEIYLKNPSIIENIMKCIINLCIDCVSNQDTFNQIGVCDCVFFAFMEHLKVERLFYLICRAMVNLCANNHYTNQTQLAKGIYPNIFIKAVMLYKANARAIEQVITCILSIVANHKVNKTKFQEAGLCEVLLDLIRISEATPSILTNCFWALSNLTSVTNPARKAVHTKIMETLRKYEEDESSPEVAKHARIAVQRIFRSASSRAATPIASMNVVGGNNINAIAAPSLPGTSNSSAGGGRPHKGGNRSASNTIQQRLEGFNESVMSDLSV